MNIMREKLLIAVGVLLVVAGVLVLVYGGIPEERHAIEIGGASFGVTAIREIPPWVGWVGIVIGAVLTTIGFTARSKTPG
jgi:hypothetical protein